MMEPRTWKVFLFLSIVAILCTGVGCDGLLATKDDPVREASNSDTMVDTVPHDHRPELTVLRDGALLLIGGVAFRLELAATDTDRAQGLMGRTALGEHEGMLFIFETEQKWPLWMKQTLIPLDAIWISGSGRIEHVETMNPEPDAKDTELTIYTPNLPCLYAIELNAGVAASMGIAVGTLIEVQHSPASMFVSD